MASIDPIEYYDDIDLTKNQLINAAIHVLAAPPASPVEGQVYYDSVKKQLGQWTGTVWIYYGSASGIYKGTGATFATLPTGGTNGDWALLTAVDGTHPIGIYSLVAGVWTIQQSLSSTLKNRETALATGGVIDQADAGVVYGLAAGGTYTVNSNVAIGELIEFSVPASGSVTITGIGTVNNVGTGLQRYVYKKLTATTYAQYQPQPPKVDQRLSTFTVTTAYVSGEIIDLTNGNGATAGRATLAASGQGSSVIDSTHNIGSSAAVFNTDNSFFVLVNGLPAVRGTDCIWDTTTSMHFTWSLLPGDSYSIFRNEWL